MGQIREVALSYVQCCGSDGKESACIARDLGSIPGLGRSPGEGKGYPFQYSGLENSVDCTIHGVAKSRTQLSNFHIHFSLSIVSRVFSDESFLHIRWPKYWSFSFNISPSSGYSGLTSFRMDWLDILAIQGALEFFSQHCNSKASILQHSTFFMVYVYTTMCKIEFMNFSRPEYWSG